uniref:Ciliary microtubule inner protein 2A-C-like domain-containing protein n=1 Tax=Lygus hesperus TaxID=30085 RepID=A0A0A9X5F1_LYGHE
MCDSRVTSKCKNLDTSGILEDRVYSSYVERLIRRTDGGGYTGHIPFGQSKYGKGYTPYTNSALCDFTTNYRRRLSTEWAPVSVIRRDPPLLIQPTEIYHKHVGMLPDYGGHVPGSKFRVGKTFGNDTRDAKRWLRGDFSM